MYKYILFVVCFYFGMFQLQAQRQIDRVAAVVGNEVILVSDIEAQFKLMESQSGGNLPENGRCIIFNQLLGNALILAEADKDSVVVSEVEVEAQLDARIGQILGMMNNNPDQFKTYYGKTPEEVKNEMRDDMRKQLVLQRMKGNIMQNISITPKEVQRFFDKIPKDSLPFFNSEVELGEIVIKPKVNKAEDTKARELAEDLRRQLVEEEADFAELARKFSDDPGSAINGGDLGITKRGDFVMEFEAAAYQLDKMEISGVVKSEYGYHIIQLLERLGNNIHTRHILIKPEITAKDEELAMNKIDSIRSLILLDSLTFSQAIQRFSEEDDSKTQAGTMMNPQTRQPYWELGDLDPKVYFAIDGLKEGDISNPIEYQTPFGETQYRIVHIRNRTKPHVANLGDDYSRIRDAATEEKRSRYIQDWVNGKIEKNYVEIKLAALGEYAKFLVNEQGQAQCEPLRRWMVKP